MDGHEVIPVSRHEVIPVSKHEVIPVSKHEVIPVSRDRFINNHYLSAIIRPQPFKLCAIISIVSLIKIVNGQDVSPEVLIDQSLYTHQDVINGRIGNDKMIELAAMYDIKLKAFMKVPDWEILKSHLNSDKHPIILHRKGHYCIIIGYIEEPMMLNSGDRIRVNNGHKQKWLVIADHRVKHKTTHDRGMLEMITLNQVMKIIRNNRNCALLMVD